MVADNLEGYGLEDENGDMIEDLDDDLYTDDDLGAEEAFDDEILD